MTYIICNFSCDVLWPDHLVFIYVLYVYLPTFFLSLLPSVSFISHLYIGRSLPSEILLSLFTFCQLKGLQLWFRSMFYRHHISTLYETQENINIRLFVYFGIDKIRFFFRKNSDFGLVKLCPPLNISKSKRATFLVKITLLSSHPHIPDPWTLLPFWMYYKFTGIHRVLQRRT